MRSTRAVLLALGLAALTASASSAADGAKRPAVESTGCRVGAVVPLQTEQVSYAARALHPLVVRRDRGRGRARFGKTNVNGVPMIFGVLAARVDHSCRPVAYRVQLPLRPNGSTGWVKAADVSLRSVRTRIAISLSHRRVTLFRDGRPIFVTTAVIGAPSTPTPTGRYYVNQRLLAENPSGDFGPGAVGISAFSPVLKTWAQGGPIAIHGTSAPDLIGFAASHGCLRVRNADILELLRDAPEGTPVTITL